MQSLFKLCSIQNIITQFGRSKDEKNEVYFDVTNIHGCGWYNGCSSIDLNMPLLQNKRDIFWEINHIFRQEVKQSNYKALNYFFLKMYRSLWFICKGVYTFCNVLMYVTQLPCPVAVIWLHLSINNSLML